MSHPPPSSPESRSVGVGKSDDTKLYDKSKTAIQDPSSEQQEDQSRGRSHSASRRDPPAWKRLISHTLAKDERLSLITTTFSDHNQIEMVRHLSGDDAQAFVDMIDEVSLCVLSSSKNCRLTSTQTSASYRLVPGLYRATDPQEVSARFIPDLWPPSLGSTIIENSTLL